MSVDLWFLAIVITVSMWLGYGLGISERKGRKVSEVLAAEGLLESLEGNELDSAPQAGAEGNIRNIRLGRIPHAASGESIVDSRKRRGESLSHVGWAISSPAQGEVSAFSEGLHKGFLIRATEGKIYAPAAGKITRLFPTGNAMRLRTEDGIEVTLLVGCNTEELEGMYFRPRVVQNEIVNKGKLLLEYDIEGIVSEGYDPTVRMIIDGAQGYRSVEYNEGKTTKIGEHLLWVRK
jgi:phosphotransferase system IIA component